MNKAPGEVTHEQEEEDEVDKIGPRLREEVVEKRVPPNVKPQKMKTMDEQKVDHSTKNPVNGAWTVKVKSPWVK